MRCSHNLGTINGLCISCGKPSLSVKRYSVEKRRMIDSQEYESEFKQIFGGTDD